MRDREFLDFCKWYTEISGMPFIPCGDGTALRILIDLYRKAGAELLELKNHRPVFSFAQWMDERDLISPEDEMNQRTWMKQAHEDYQKEISSCWPWKAMTAAEALDDLMSYPEPLTGKG